MSRIRLLGGSKFTIHQKKDKDVTISRHDAIIKFFDVAFLLLILVTGPSFMSIAWLVLEIWQFLFIKDWPEIWKSEIPQSEFCHIPGDWGKLEIPKLVGMFIRKSYWVLKNASVTAFTVCELLGENQTGGGGLPDPPLTFWSSSNETISYSAICSNMLFWFDIGCTICLPNTNCIIFLNSFCMHLVFDDWFGFF